MRVYDSFIRTMMPASILFYITICFSQVLVLSYVVTFPASFGSSSARVWNKANKNERAIMGGASFSFTGGGLSPKMTVTERHNSLEMSELDEEVLFADFEGVLTTNGKSVSRISSSNGSAYNNDNQRSSGVGGIVVNPLDRSLKDPLINALADARATLTSCPGIWSAVSSICPDRPAVIDPYHGDKDDPVERSFGQMNEAVNQSAAAFRSLGVGKGDHVAILGENSASWLLADHGIQRAGGVSAVRGADAPADELRYIYSHSDSVGVAVLQGPKLLQKLLKAAEEDDMDMDVGDGNVEDSSSVSAAPLGLYNKLHGPVRHLVLLHREKQSMEDVRASVAHLEGLKVHLLSELMEEASKVETKRKPFPSVGRDDLSTIVYTSGTTGRPKGVMLSHGNLLHQIGHRLSPTKRYDETEPLPGDTMLSLLPVWHITERTFELWMFGRGCHIVYSSIRTFQKDLAFYKPQWMVLVPRVLEKVASGVKNKFNAGSATVRTLVKLFTATGEAKNKHSQIAKGLVVGDQGPSFLQKTRSRAVLAALAPLNALGNTLVWKKVQNGFGGRQKVIISGGSALSGTLESFYQMCGIPILVGYGLTECSPLLSFRRSDDNLITAGCVGDPCAQTSIRIVNPEDPQKRPLPDGIAGVVQGKGPQVMRGYYKNPAATAAAIDGDGWFDSGDLGRINPATGHLILTGRIKDTIVLSNGENVEPVPIEDAILAGTVGQIDQVMLTGQDGKQLTAIAVLVPESEEAQKWQERVNDPQCTPEDSENFCQLLQEASITLRADSALKKSILTSIKAATSEFRPWEQIGDVYMTLEPFAMSNGLLTQSYKVKRNVVAERYSQDLQSI